MAALSAKTIQNAFLAQDLPRTKHNTGYPCDFRARNTRSMHSFQGCKLTLADTLAKRLNTTSTAWISFRKQVNITCNATQGTTAVSSSEKVDFLKLQNGSDIRGVAIAGVEGEPVNLTEPVTEAIAAAFAAWLLNKKKADGLRRLRISVGHDSRISAHKLQNAVTHGITAAGHDVLQFGLASTPAMFNSCSAAAVPFLHYLPGLFASFAALMFNCVKKEDINDNYYSPYDDSEWRLKLWLFISYVVSFVSLAGAVGFLVQDALTDTGPSAWTGIAGVLQTVFVLISGLIYWTCHSED